MSIDYCRPCDTGLLKAKDDPQLAAQIDEYISQLKQEMENMTCRQCQSSLVSAYNYQQRRQLPSCLGLGLKVSRGDICYIDFGRTYIQEAGYQHFGLIAALTLSKAFVIPMTSNQQAYAKAYDAESSPQGRLNLFRLGQIEGLNKPSTLFINDSKYINTARIINVCAHIDVDSRLYKTIIIRLLDCLDF